MASPRPPSCKGRRAIRSAECRYAQSGQTNNICICRIRDAQFEVLRFEVMKTDRSNSSSNSNSNSNSDSDSNNNTTNTNALSDGFREGRS